MLDATTSLKRPVLRPSLLSLLPVIFLLTQVKCQVEEQTKDAKIIIFKKKRRKGYKRKTGFRREVTILRVLEIEGE